MALEKERNTNQTLSQQVQKFCKVPSLNNNVYLSLVTNLQQELATQTELPNDMVHNEGETLIKFTFLI